MSLLIDNILKHVALTLQEQELFLSKTETRHYKAKTILLNDGEVCKNSYFVNSGVLGSFNINDHIVEHVMSFACQGWWISDMYSLISQKPGNLFIEVIEDAEVVLLSKENQEQLYYDIPKLERFFRILTENALVANQQRIMDNLSCRLKNVLKSSAKNILRLCSKFLKNKLLLILELRQNFLVK